MNPGCGVLLAFRRLILVGLGIKSIAGKFTCSFQHQRGFLNSEKNCCGGLFCGARKCQEGVGRKEMGALNKGFYFCFLVVEWTENKAGRRFSRGSPSKEHFLSSLLFPFIV